MKAVRLIAPGRMLEAQDVPVPEPGPGDVLVRVKAAGICHSDAHYRAGKSRVHPLPLTLGHEVAGVVEKTGADVSRLKRGDRVCLHYLATCGDCPSCHECSEQFCATAEMIGKHRDGGYAEYILMPARSVFPLPAEIPFEHGAVMMCSSATSLHALNKARLRPGETVALVGSSGSGKTSLVNLVPRFYEPTAGRLFIDGHDITTLTLASLRAQIALVSQDVLLFDDTIAANIAYGVMTGTPREAIERAAAAGHALEFIRALPQGFDTEVGENGVRLSGGQRQRIAIARAILKDAPILILDEATSALDSESERQVQAALDTLMQGRTTIVIAHRLSTIEHADRIVVLDQGRVVEEGTHAALLARGGIYAKLHRMQFAMAA